MSSDTFTSQIPQGDPHKRELEEAVRAALLDQPLPWDVEITRSCTSRARFFINLKQARTGLRRTVFVNGLRSQGLRRVQKRIRDVCSQGLSSATASTSAPSLTVPPARHG